MNIFIIFQTVDLGENEISDTGVSTLGEALRTHVRLHMLFLDSNKLTSKGSLGLAECLKNK